jgi:hypothetical protein
MDMAAERRSALNAREDHSGAVRRGTMEHPVDSNALLQMKRGLTPLNLAEQPDPLDPITGF